MAHYFFDVFDGSKAVIDDHGDAFADVSEAADQATGLLADLVQEILPHRRAQDFAVAVRGHDGRDVYRAALIFRDTHLDPKRPASMRDLCPPVMVPNPVELIREARDTLATSLSLMQRGKAAIADVSEVLRQVAETMTQATETMRLTARG